MASGSRSIYVDTADPTLAIACPNCGLLAARFSQYCRNCGYRLWPSAEVAAAAFLAWQRADPEHRRRARTFDTEYREPSGPALLDYGARARQLGIHIFPNSNNPFVICVGIFFLFLALPRFPAAFRITVGVVGLIILLIGVVGWVLREDPKMYEEAAEHDHAAVH